MKNLIAVTLALFVGLFLAHSIRAEKTDTNPDLYYYAFVLSCGKIIYYTSPIELSSAVLAEMSENYELEICGTNL